ncbi:hexokinase, putative, partial [Eimeria maxima]
MTELSNAFKEEIIKGLEMHKKYGLKWVPELCSLRMLDSCVSKIPNGNEKGIFYALDFGGTNVRAVRCELIGDGKIISQQSLKNLYECGGEIDLMARETSASLLFDVLISNIEELINKNNDKEKLNKQPAKLGFTFSFPCAQSELNNSVLESWTKGFATGHDTDDPVVGKDVVELLTAAIKRKGLGLECAAVVNDTVGTLLSCCYQKGVSSPPCTVGVILGTGSNCCYLEPQAKEYNYKGNIINVESVRLLCLQILQDKAPPKAKVEFSFDAKLAAVLAATMIPEETGGTGAAGAAAGAAAGGAGGAAGEEAAAARVKEILKDNWQWEATREEINIMRNISFAVFDRSAALAAISIAVLTERSKALENNGKVTVAVDGSLYVRNKWYGKRIEYYLYNLIGINKQERIILRAADDGS